MLKTTGKIGSRPCWISIMPTWITETKKQHLPFTSASKADQINRKPYQDLHLQQSPELVWLIDNILKGESFRGSNRFKNYVRMGLGVQPHIMSLELRRKIV